MIHLVDPNWGRSMPATTVRAGSALAGLALQMRPIVAHGNYMSIYPVGKGFRRLQAAGSVCASRTSVLI